MRKRGWLGVLEHERTPRAQTMQGDLARAENPSAEQGANTFRWRAGMAFPRSKSNFCHCHHSLSHSHPWAFECGFPLVPMTSGGGAPGRHPPISRFSHWSKPGLGCPCGQQPSPRQLSCPCGHSPGAASWFILLACRFIYLSSVHWRLLIIASRSSIHPPLCNQRASNGV